jgi:hypothetical protein
MCMFQLHKSLCREINLWHSNFGGGKQRKWVKSCLDKLAKNISFKKIEWLGIQGSRMFYVGIGVQHSNCIKLFFLNCIILNIGHTHTHTHTHTHNCFTCAYMFKYFIWYTYKVPKLHCIWLRCEYWDYHTEDHSYRSL